MISDLLDSFQLHSNSYDFILVSLVEFIDWAGLFQANFIAFNKRDFVEWIFRLLVDIDSEIQKSHTAFLDISFRFVDETSIFMFWRLLGWLQIWAIKVGGNRSVANDIFGLSGNF